MQGSTRKWQLGDGREDAQQVKPAAFGGSAHVHEHQRTTIHAILRARVRHLDDEQRGPVSLGAEGKCFPEISAVVRGELGGDDSRLIPGRAERLRLFLVTG